MINFKLMSLEENATQRIDKWLWAVRIYKTRSGAADACRSSAVRINEGIAKPSAKVRVGDRITARTSALTRTLVVTGLTEKRIGPTLVENYLNDQTPQSEKDAAREKRAHARLFALDQGGRPTKKDRREIEKLLGPDW